MVNYLPDNFRSHQQMPESPPRYFGRLLRVSGSSNFDNLNHLPKQRGSDQVPALLWNVSRESQEQQSGPDAKGTYLAAPGITGFPPFFQARWGS